MILVDTSAWIEWLTGSVTAERLSEHLPEQSAWLTREVGEDKADQVIAFTQICILAPLDTETALSAAEVSRTLRLAMADAVIYATALAHGARILTCDAHFEGLPSVVYVPKNN